MTNMRKKNHLIIRNDLSTLDNFFQSKKKTDALLKLLEIALVSMMKTTHFTTLITKPRKETHAYNQRTN